MTNLIESTGAWVQKAADGAGYTLRLTAQSLMRAGVVLTRLREVVRQMEVAGVLSLPVVCLVALFSGWIVALQTGFELAKYGQEGQIGTLVGAFMVREWGPVMTAFILAGRVGSAMAAELGTMRVSEEVDALEVMNVDPISYLVAPRVMALLLMGPVLTIFATVIGIWGGALVSVHQLQVPVEIYYMRAEEIIQRKDVLAGLLKSFMFGITLAIVGCSQGLRASHGAEDVGRATRNAVVVSIILVLMMNYFTTWFFYGPPAEYLPEILKTR